VSDRSGHRDRKKDPLDQVIYALGHPLRRRILTSLARERGSAKTLSKELGQPLSNVSYHLNEVLYRECGVIERVDEIQRRGATERLYIVKAQAFQGVLPWIEIPEPLRSYLCRHSFKQFLAIANTSLMGGAIDPLDGSRLEWRPAEVDRHGWLELRAAADQFSEAVGAAIENSRRRTRRGSKSSELFVVVVALASFPAAN